MLVLISHASSSSSSSSSCSSAPLLCGVPQGVASHCTCFLAGHLFSSLQDVSCPLLCQQKRLHISCVSSSTLKPDKTEMILIWHNNDCAVRSASVHVSFHSNINSTAENPGIVFDQCLVLVSSEISAKIHMYHVFYGSWTINPDLQAAFWNNRRRGSLTKGRCVEGIRIISTGEN